MSDQVKDSYRGMEARAFAKGGMPSKDEQIASLRAQLAEARQSLGCGQSDDVAIEIETLKALKESFEFRVASQSATLSRLREALRKFLKRSSHNAREMELEMRTALSLLDPVASSDPLG